MKKFIFKVILFGVSVFTGIILLIFSASFQVRKSPYSKVDKKIENIILGHSHAACAYDESFINKTLNMAQSGESYFYSYIKIRTILEQENSIKNVLIEFSNNQINYDMDKWIWEEKYLAHRYPMYSSFMNVDEKFELIKTNPRVLLNSQPLAVRKQFVFLLSGESNEETLPAWGGYEVLLNSKIDSLVTHERNEKLIGDFENFEKSTNMIYLKKIIELCNSKKIGIYLLRSPYHKNYKFSRNEEVYQRILKKHFLGIKFIDLRDFPLENECFHDYEHLNKNGAKKLSVFFNSLLSKQIIDKVECKTVIDSLMQRSN